MEAGMRPVVRFAAVMGLSAAIAGTLVGVLLTRSQPLPSEPLPHAQQVLFTGCSYTSGIPAPSNGFNGSAGQFSVTATNETGSPVRLHALVVQFSSFLTGNTVASETVHPDVTLAAGGSRQLSFAAPRALYTLQENDPQAYGNADGSDIDCSQDGWS
jgi:hypothetical protein